MKADTFTNTVIVADTTKVLPELIKMGKKYHVIIADPPYNIGKDFGQGKEIKALDDYVVWAESWIKDCLRLLTDDGLLYLYGFPEIIARISVRFPIDEQRWLVWHYTNKTVPSLKFWQRSHETILCMWKPNMPHPDIEIDQIREPNTENHSDNEAQQHYGSLGESKNHNSYEDLSLPRDVIKIPA